MTTTTAITMRSSIIDSMSTCRTGNRIRVAGGEASAKVAAAADRYEPTASKLRPAYFSMWIEEKPETLWSKSDAVILGKIISGSCRQEGWEIKTDLRVHVQEVKKYRPIDKYDREPCELTIVRNGGNIDGRGQLTSDHFEIPKGRCLFHLRRLHGQCYSIVNGPQGVAEISEL